MGVCALRSELTVFAVGKPTMLASHEVESLGEALVRRGQRLFVVEASAGGALQARLSAPAGASRWFLGGLTCYHDSLKTAVLGLAPQTLIEHGAVSEASVREMAACARRLSGADWVLVESGVYGPGGGSPEKPVGLVLIAMGDGATTQLARHQFAGDRAAIREAAAAQAVRDLHQAVSGNSSAILR